MTCDPQTIVMAAQCYQCLYFDTLDSIQLLLLCQWAGLDV